jgi:hypothetical protein
MNPAPGLYYSAPISAGVEGLVTLGGVPIGHVTSQWDEGSQSVINTTEPDHEFKAGIVIRQLSLVGNTIYMTTFGEGNSTDGVHAFLNGNLGPGGFVSMDDQLSADLAAQPGFVGYATGVGGTASHSIIPNFLLNPN